MGTVYIRGAITVNENAKAEILNKTEILLNEIINSNEINIDDILSIVFTATKDIDQAYPAVTARSIGITSAALMCVQEMYVVGSLEKCIRVMVNVQSCKKQTEVKHIYLENARALRPDLCKK